MSGPLNSPVSDNEPVSLVQPPKVSKPEISDWEKLGKSKKYSIIDQYLEQRKAAWQKMLPSGQPISGLSAEERAHAWATADAVITEILGIQSQIAANTKR